MPWLGSYSLSGVRRYLPGLGIRLRSAAVQQRGPDPEYAAKEARLLAALREAAARPAAEHGDEADRQWRIVGALEPLGGRVRYPDGYVVGRKQLIEFYGRLARAYPGAGRVYVVRDNWSVHRHDDVLAALAGDWPALLARVRGFLDRFALGSEELLRYAGLAGDGKPAAALRPG